MGLVKPVPDTFLRARTSFVFLVALAAGCANELGPSPRGVLLVSIDSLRADHLSCYGYRSATNPGLDTSPVIDRMLAASGARFTQAVSTTSWTLPSHMSMLTGLPAELHGVRELGLVLDDDKTLLAEVFRSAGWRTGGFWSGPNVHPFFGFGRGFEAYVDCSTSTVSDPEALFAIGPGLTAEEIDAKSADLKSLHGSSHVGQTGPRLVAAFDTWFDEIGDDERFFAFVHMWDVHYDYEPPPEFDRFDPSYAGRDNGVGVTERYPGTKPPAPRDLEHIIALYDGEILFTDHNVGRLLERLQRAGRLDDTLVVLTSDHGEEFREHGMFGHGNTLYEESVRVPLILRYPERVPAGTTVDATASLVDVAPTILELCDLPAPDGMWGRSLLPALGGDLAQRPAPMERTWMRPAPDTDEGFTVQSIRGVHSGTHKLVRETDRDGGRVYFFDLEADPTERSPIVTGQLGKGDARVVEARALWRDLDRRAAQLDAPGAMPEDLEQGLGAAGYLGDDR
jgi:arylsulfatase A-like enzyme